MLTGGRGVKFAKILLTSYVNAPLSKLIKTFTNCINRHNFSEKFKTVGQIFSPISIQIFINVYAIENKFDAQILLTGVELV